jgi:hypothetical protein
VVLEGPRWVSLVERYRQNENVVLFSVYSIERHPGEPGFVGYKHPESLEEKMAYALEAHARWPGLPLAVDTFDETVLNLYGRAPNPVFVIDPNFKMVYRATWTDSSEVEIVIQRLLDFWFPLSR